MSITELSSIGVGLGIDARVSTFQAGTHRDPHCTPVSTFRVTLSYRDLVLLTAFAVVFGTLVIQGLTLKPLIALMGFKGEDPVGEEVKCARAEGYRAAIAAIDGDASGEAMLLRKQYGAAISPTESDGRLEDLPGNAIRRAAIVAARNKANALGLEGPIGDAAYRVLESEFDWAEPSAGSAAFR